MISRRPENDRLNASACEIGEVTDNDDLVDEDDDKDIHDDDYADGLVDEAPEEPRTLKVLEGIATFQDVMVWGHEVVPDEEDAYVKGLQEWIGLAKTVGLSYDSNTHLVYSVLLIKPNRCTRWMMKRTRLQ